MKKQNRKRLQAAKDSKAYRHRNRNWGYCRYIIECRLVELRDQLTVHLEAVDEENVTDVDLATTKVFNSEIADLEMMRATLVAGPKSVSDEFTKLMGDRMWSSRGLFIPPLPPPPPPSPPLSPLSPEDRRRRLLLKWMTVHRDCKRRWREQDRRTSLYEKVTGPRSEANPTSAKDYSDVVANELRRILARADELDEGRQ